MIVHVHMMYLFQLQENVVNGRVCVASKEDGVTPGNQCLNQTGNGGCFACTWHAKDETVVMATKHLGDSQPKETIKTHTIRKIVAVYIYPPGKDGLGIYVLFLQMSVCVSVMDVIHFCVTSVFVQ